MTGLPVGIEVNQESAATGLLVSTEVKENEPLSRYEVTHGKVCIVGKYWKDNGYLVDFSERLEGLILREEVYAPEPVSEGQMPEVNHWDKYLAVYMTDGPEQESIDPEKMFFEDRWVLVSRAFGKEFCMKLFYHVIEWHVRAIHTKQTGSRVVRGRTNNEYL